MLPDNTIAKLPKNENPTLHSILYSAAVITEVGMDLKERFVAGEKYICYLKTVIAGADKAISALHSISKSSLEQAQQILNSVGENGVSPTFKHERDRLLTVIEKQLLDLDLHIDGNFDNTDVSRISEKIRSVIPQYILLLDYIKIK